MDGEAVRMLHLGLGGREPEEKSQHAPVLESARDKPALVLDREHDIGIVGRVVLPPDVPLETFGVLELGHAVQFTQHEPGDLHVHLRISSAWLVAVSR